MAGVGGAVQLVGHSVDVSPNPSTISCVQRVHITLVDFEGGEI